MRSSKRSLRAGLLGVMGVVLLPSLVAFGAEGAPKKKVVLWDLDFKATDDKSTLEGSIWAIGDPVHETITLHALKQAKVVSQQSTTSSTDTKQFIRGVFWNDDPCGDLFFGDSGLFPSTGYDWYSDFKAADEEAQPKKFAGLDCRLLGRSHFGNLQFLHGMANNDGVEAKVTLELMMAWAKFAYGLALGTIEDTTDLTQRADLKPIGSLEEHTIARTLFVSPNSDSTKQRAMASLLHMVQDSYAPGHTLRVQENGQYGAVQQFHSYARQDHDKHKKDDMWQGGSSDMEKILKAKGGKESLRASKVLLEHYKAKDPWSKVEVYLRNGPFKLAKTAIPSGP